MWKRTLNGQVLRFHLSGINNQNFIMQDEETGSYWQQVTGKAISGPLKGSALELASTNELSFGLWKNEAPNGTVLQMSGPDSKHYESDWEEKLKKYPSILRFSDSNLDSREVVLGISLNGADRAFVLQKVLLERIVHDEVGGTNLILVAGPDNKSVRAFRSGTLEFFAKEGEPGKMMDSANMRVWDFRGCSGDACLEPVPLLKDFWFDWRQYHPRTTVYQK